MARCLLLFLATSLAMSVAASPVKLGPDDPALDGKDYLISDADFRAIMSYSRDWLARTHPRMAVRRVHVITHDTIQLYVRDNPNPNYGPDEKDYLSFEIQRSKAGWRVTADNSFE